MTSMPAKNIECKLCENVQRILNIYRHGTNDVSSGAAKNITSCAKPQPGIIVQSLVKLGLDSRN